MAGGSGLGLDVQQDGGRLACGQAASGYRAASEFAEPVSGWITVQSGTRDGKGRVRGGRVETSKDGRFWNRAGNFSSKTGDCRFQQRTPIGFLRVLPEAGRPEPLVLREVAVEQDGERDGG